MLTELMEMPRGLDHVVHAVRDLDAAASFYRGLGFTVGARNQHPWGTSNHIVQLPGFFVELLGVEGRDHFGTTGFEALFANANARFLRQHEGLSFVMLESSDAQADEAAFRGAGIGVSDVLTFEREGVRPDGSRVTLGFSLAFARDPRAPDVGFATCWQHHPECFWNPALQQHANSVDGIVGIVLVAENPTDHHIFLSAFTGERELQATSTGITAATPRGDVQIMTPAAYRSHFGVEPPDIAAGARLAALRFNIRDREAFAKAFDAAGVPFSCPMGAAVVAPDIAMGATLVFRAEGRHGGG
jgi:catechol 2,3-dioxygenase-like lactoylglutathione lyase family enzyme